MGQTIACANQKGGVGKTTTVVNLGTYLAMAGQRVLLVDVDPQGNATSGLGIDRTPGSLTLYDSLVEGAQIEPSIVPTGVPGLSLVPSSVELAGADVELAAVDQRERRLRRVLEAVRSDYDYILLDCPPSLGLLTVNALTAADAVLIPLQSEYYALEGLTQLIATVNLVRDHLNPQLEIAGVVLTMYDARTNLSADVAGEARRHLGAAVFNTIIPRNVRLSEAPSFGLPIALYRPDSRGAESYAALTDELLRRDRDGGGHFGPSTLVTRAPVRQDAPVAGVVS
ncbi:MAG TPA: AAA family ATPase [Candidatus Limnocylindrales bacterium]|nr:AAA family ATPase [Candidatus Limnocylindrales bacterium]